MFSRKRLNRVNNTSTERVGFAAIQIIPQNEGHFAAPKGKKKRNQREIEEDIDGKLHAGFQN